MRAPRVVVGMSGGVDSSVAAWLLKQQGFEVVGLFMKNWEDDDTDEYCTSRADLVDAASVADVIGIELEAVNFAREYSERVFAHFLREYPAGRTPNPDVLCNSEIKFRAFLDHALALGADHIATGHYARVRDADGRVELLKAVDATKDQSYFLHRLTQEQLAPVMFPLGDCQARRARDRQARGHADLDEKGLDRDLLHRRAAVPRVPRALPAEDPGRCERPTVFVVGHHHGLAFYTLGQRQGLGIGGVRSGSDLPWFVAAKDHARNALVVVQGHDHALLYRRTVDAQELHWIAGEPPDGPALSGVGAKTRYRMPDASCRLELRAGDRCRAVFDAPQWAPTPGQYLVLYRGEVCLGGGVIASEALSAHGTPEAAAVVDMP